jgi:hypothetical protein
MSRKLSLTFHRESTKTYPDGFTEPSNYSGREIVEFSITVLAVDHSGQPTLSLISFEKVLCRSKAPGATSEYVEKDFESMEGKTAIVEYTDGAAYVFDRAWSPYSEKIDRWIMRNIWNLVLQYQTPFRGRKVNPGLVLPLTDVQYKKLFRSGADIVPTNVVAKVHAISDGGKQVTVAIDYKHKDNRRISALVSGRHFVTIDVKSARQQRFKSTMESKFIAKPQGKKYTLEGKVSGKYSSSTKYSRKAVKALRDKILASKPK